MAFTMTTLMAVMALLAREGWAWDIPSYVRARNLGGQPQPDCETNLQYKPREYGGVTVDGKTGDWVLGDNSPDFFHKMHTAGDPDKSCTAKAYARWNCKEMCVLVHAEPGHTIDESTNDAWMKDYDMGRSVLKHSKFEWVKDEAGNIKGWEACFPSMQLGCRSIEIHANYDSGQTASTGKNKQGYCKLYLTGECSAATIDNDTTSSTTSGSDGTGSTPTEPAPTGPAPVAPAPTEPALVAPAPTEPAPVASAPTEPAPTGGNTCNNNGNCDSGEDAITCPSDCVAYNNPPPSGDCGPMPLMGVHEPDGTLNGWNLEWTFFKDMWEAGNPTKNCLSKAYTKWDPKKNMLCVLVKAEPGVYLSDNMSDSWTKDYTQSTSPLGKVIFIKDGDNTIGWEGCFPMPPGPCDELEIHTNTIRGQTSSTGKKMQGYSKMCLPNEARDNCSCSSSGSDGSATANGGGDGDAKSGDGASFVCPRYELDFEGLKRGQYITDQLKADFRVTISATATGKEGYTPNGAARVFDTALPGGNEGDPDLGSPNEDCPGGGPGIGAGGAPDSQYPNCEPQGMVLIVQESDKDTPDDNAGGGSITFDFDIPAKVEEIAILDIDDDHTVTVEVTHVDGTVSTFQTESTGDNGLFRLTVGIDDAIQLKVIFPSSGAVAHLNYYICPQAVCGDGTCNSDAGETAASCSTDCAGSCGDKICHPSEESSCPDDCSSKSFCGDGICDTNKETSSSCPGDCASPPKCGDGVCQDAENPSDCPQDCGSPTSCGNELCEADETMDSCPQDCTGRCGDGVCGTDEDTDSCPLDCGDDGSGADGTSKSGAGTAFTPSDCGDGTCDTDETVDACPEDCGQCQDGICDSTETVDTCAEDCSNCGDGQCTGPETLQNCAEDCSVCGDKKCTGSEMIDNCADDCSVCGDNKCTGPETLDACANDCSVCGDGQCTGSETIITCVNDCSICGDGQCKGLETVDTCTEDCSVCGDKKCTGSETVDSCAEDCSVCGDNKCTGPETLDGCANDCSVCGDSACTGPETVANCAKDCSVCGDEKCTGSETAGTCPDDCTACGDGQCTGTENVENCVSDCSFCGDDICDSTEDCTSCSDDCENPTDGSGADGASMIQPVCGDGICEADETIQTCAQDCGRCQDGFCDATESIDTCAEDCSKCGDGICTGLETPQNCAEDCAVCGDNQCTGTETVVTCADDCSVCGDDQCTGPETVENCVNDCSICGDNACTGPETLAACADDCSVCGDSKCTGPETLQNCAEDCSVCGDSQCTGSETIHTCANDCSACNDGQCTGLETVDACAEDCSVCGDNKCTGLETVDNCAEDCSDCGDNKCTGPETLENCAMDCVKCGDGECTTGLETLESCALDCGECGDGICDATENSTSCPNDCTNTNGFSGSAVDDGTGADGTSSLTKCGDGKCDNHETVDSCPKDCMPDGGSCGDGICSDKEDTMSCVADCPAACVCGDGKCHGPYEDVTNCPTDCPGTCGDGVCHNSENPSTCKKDCGSPIACGNTVCESGETAANCPNDCDGTCGDGKCHPKEALSGSCPSDCNNASSGANGSGGAAVDDGSGANGSSKSGDGAGYAPGGFTMGGCMEDNWKTAGNDDSLLCTAKEVYAQSLKATADTTCTPGEMIKVTIEGVVHFNSDRFDPAFYVATDGGDALNGSCASKPFRQTDKTDFLDQNTMLSWDNDAKGGNDDCGDVLVSGGKGGDVAVTLAMEQEILCVDENEDGTLDMSVCFSWKTNGSDSKCEPAAVLPGGKSKCWCDTFEVANVVVEVPPDVTTLLDGSSISGATLPYAKCE